MRQPDTTNLEDKTLEGEKRVPYLQANALDWILEIILRAVGLKSVLAYCSGPEPESDDPLIKHGWKKQTNSTETAEQLAVYSKLVLSPTSSSALMRQLRALERILASSQDYRRIDYLISRPHTPASLLQPDDERKSRSQPVCSVLSRQPLLHQEYDDISPTEIVNVQLLQTRFESLLRESATSSRMPEASSHPTASGKPLTERNEYTRRQKLTRIGVIYLVAACTAFASWKLAEIGPFELPSFLIGISIPITSFIGILLLNLCDRVTMHINAERDSEQDEVIKIPRFGGAKRAFKEICDCFNYVFRGKETILPAIARFDFLPRARIAADSHKIRLRGLLDNQIFNWISLLLMGAFLGSLSAFVFRSSPPYTDLKQFLSVIGVSITLLFIWIVASELAAFLVPISRKRILVGVFRVSSAIVLGSILIRVPSLITFSAVNLPEFANRQSAIYTVSTAIKPAIALVIMLLFPAVFYFLTKIDDILLAHIMRLVALLLTVVAFLTFATVSISNTAEIYRLGDDSFPRIVPVCEKVGNEIRPRWLLGELESGLVTDRKNNSPESARHDNIDLISNQWAPPEGHVTPARSSIGTSKVRC